jgi:hypothetical protein
MSNVAVPNASRALRPMSVADIVDEMFRLYRRHFLKLFALSALLFLTVIIVAGVVLVPVLLTGLNSPDVAVLAIDIAVAVLVAAIVLTVLTASLTLAVSEVYLGRDIGIGTAIRRGLQAALRLIVAYVVIIAIIVVVVIAISLAFALLTGGLLAFSGPSVSPAQVGGAALFVLLYVLAIIVPVVWLGATWMFVTQAIVIEGAGALGSLGRSRFLAAGSRWRVIGITLLLTIVQLVITTIPGSILGVFLQQFGTAGVVVNQLLSLALGIVYNPISYGALTLLYYDLRVRKEGLDLSLAAERLAPA